VRWRRGEFETPGAGALALSTSQTVERGISFVGRTPAKKNRAERASSSCLIQSVLSTLLPGIDASQTGNCVTGATAECIPRRCNLAARRSLGKHSAGRPSSSSSGTMAATTPSVHQLVGRQDGGGFAQPLRHHSSGFEKVVRWEAFRNRPASLAVHLGQCSCLACKFYTASGIY
jgi:hypothetical protein